MSFAIIDQGRRVKTPLRSIFPDKGVDQTSASEATHSGTHNHKDLQSSNNEFARIMQHSGSPRDERTPGTYDELKPSAAAEPKKAGLLAQQIMSHPVHSIVEGTIVHSAWERMQELKISHLMIVDPQGKPVGILSARNIIALGKDSTLSITNYYSQKLIAGSPYTEVTQIAACFLDFEINAIPIFDHNEKLVGIVCRSDLLRLIISGAHIERWA
ncbi:MAG: CBS domain-containing protein [Oceanospirillaceae bacterium]|nr:CBS domain-containing protein [Oceanospirillaceae bacterium]